MHPVGKPEWPRHITRKGKSQPIASDVVDIFGDGAHFSNETDDNVDVESHVNESTMVRFGRSNARDVMVLSPQHLANEIDRQLYPAAEAYE